MSSAVCLLNKMTPYKFFQCHLSHQEAIFTIPSVVHYPDHNESTCLYHHLIMCISWVKSSYLYVPCDPVPPKEVPCDPIGHSFSDWMGFYIHIVEYILNTFGPRWSLCSAALVHFYVNTSFSAVFVLGPNKVLHNIFERVYTNLCTSHSQGSMWTLLTCTLFLHMDFKDFYDMACDMGLGQGRKAFHWDIQWSSIDQLSLIIKMTIPFQPVQFAVI